MMLTTHPLGAKIKRVFNNLIIRKTILKFFSFYFFFFGLFVLFVRVLGLVYSGREAIAVRHSSPLIT